MGETIRAQAYSVDWQGRLKPVGGVSSSESVLTVEAAVQALRDGDPGTVVQIDMRGDNPARLIALWEDERMR